MFFRLLDKHFPRTSRLYKIFHRNTVKVSYSCMENVRQIIRNHSNYVSRKKPKSTPSCNCKKKDKFPMNGNCLKNNMIYKCTVSPTTTTKQRAYPWLAEGEWTQRYYKHRQSFRDARHKNNTALSSYLWGFKKKTSEIRKLTWSIRKIQTFQWYSDISKLCVLCLHEKLHIATYHDQEELLNKRSELILKCRHENRLLLASCKAND